MAITRTEYNLVRNDNGSTVRGDVRSKETTYVGCVISTHTRCERVMSDIYADVSYAVVWDREAQRTREVYLQAHFELTDHIDVAVEVDLSEEVKAEMRAVTEREETRLAEYEVEAARKAEAAAREARKTEVRKGVKVRVTTAHKSLPPVGAEGQCIWTGTCRYTGNPRMGVKVGGEVYWGPTACVERVGRAKKAKAAPKPKAQPKPTTQWDHLDYEDNEIDF